MKNRVYLKIVIMILIISFLPLKGAEAAILRVDAVSAIAIDSKTGTVLFDQNAHKVIPMASTTKIITSLVALECSNLDEVVEISKNAASVRGSTVGYKAGDKVTMRELLYGLMLRSGNDCAIAIAEGISGSVPEFCELMNEFALSIGLLDSHFESPHGLDSLAHYSSAYDLALVTKKAKEIDEFNKIVSTKLIGEEEGVKFTREFNNINKLLYQEPNCTGVKTGYTGQAGKCLVSSFKVDDKNEIIVVTLNCTPRWRESQKIYEYVKENYEYKKVIKAGEIVEKIEIDGTEKNIPLTVKEDLVLPVRHDEVLRRTINIPKYEVDVPLKTTDTIGTITFTNALNSKYALSLYPTKDMEKIGILERIMDKINKK